MSTEERKRISERLRRLEQAVDEEPKSVKWKLRARVGDRMRWYEMPEEDDGDGV